MRIAPTLQRHHPDSWGPGVYLTLIQGLSADAWGGAVGGFRYAQVTPLSSGLLWLLNLVVGQGP